MEEAEAIFAEISNELNLDPPKQKLQSFHKHGEWKDVRKQIYNLLFGFDSLPVNSVGNTQVSVHHIDEKAGGGAHSRDNLLPILHTVHMRLSGHYRRRNGNAPSIGEQLKNKPAAMRRAVGYKILFEQITPSDEAKLHALMKQMGQKTFHP